MGYIPNDLRAVVRMYPEAGDVCLLIASRAGEGFPDSMTARIISACMAAVPDPSHPMSLANYDPAADYSREDTVLPHPLCSGVCSKFITYGPPNASLYKSLAERGVPAVSLGEDVPFPNVTSIVFDHSLAAELAVAHLFKLGHERLGIVSGPFGSLDSNILELNRGVLRAHETRGILI